MHCLLCILFYALYSMKCRGAKGRAEVASNPVGRKEKQKKPSPKEPARRVRGKLSKKEQKAMKKSHKDIGWLLPSPPPMETVIHEKAMERETEDMEVVDEEREARIERMRRKALE